MMNLRAQKNSSVAVSKNLGITSFKATNLFVIFAWWKHL